jgi:predicted small integral membrane protein
MSFSIVAAEEVAQQALFLPIWAFPAIAAAFFLVGGIITFTYRDVANRHSNKSHAAESHDDHGGHGH